MLPSKLRGRPKALLVLLPVAALLGGALSWAMQSNPYLWDTFNFAFPSTERHNIILVGIDDESLKDYGRINEWNRELYARAVNTLEVAGARTIGIDLLFDTPAPGDQELINTLSQYRNIVLSTSLQEPNATERFHVESGVSNLNLLSNITSAKTSYFQTGYLDITGKLWPSFNAQVARNSHLDVPITPHEQLLRYRSSQPLPQISFKDVLSGNFKYSDVQDKIVLIGVTAQSLPGVTFLDSSLTPVPGVRLQGRAVASLFGPAYRPLPSSFVTVLGALIAIIAVLLGSYWGFWLALGSLLLSTLAFGLHILLPGLTYSLIAMLSGLLTLAERSWRLRVQERYDPMTGVGNRISFTRAVELRWPHRAQHPLGVILIDLQRLRLINERYGRQTGNQVLRRIAQELQHSESSREMTFRWNGDEFVILLENATATELEALSSKVSQDLSQLQVQDMRVHVSVGNALSTPEMQNFTELLEQASRERYRMKYQTEPQFIP